MKTLINLFAVLGLLVMIGCGEETGIVSPKGEELTQGLNKEWIALPEKDPSSALVESTFKRSERIDRRNGGNISIWTGYRMRYSRHYSRYNSNDLQISAKLTIPPYAFNDGESKYFTIEVDEETCSVKFQPSPFVFDQPLIFNLTIRNIDLSEFDESNVDFAYLAEDGSIEKAKYDRIIVDKENGILEVKNAVIPHFSRFGFVN